jgi:hypothetical protein
MARPRIFVSSTYYDLKHIRSSLDLFIQSLGYDSILSEKGDIAYTSEDALDVSCFREVETADIFVMIVGGRYGSASSRESKKPSRDFFEKYDSVTELEHEAAVKKDVPIYILVENAVYAEYQTYLRNKEATNVHYAHVDSVNVFLLLESLLSHPRNNPLKTFERFADIENWLREQWAGTFREFLHRASSQKQLAALSDQVNVLQQMADTLKKYLEEVVGKVSPKNAAELIQHEDVRLAKLKQVNEATHNPFVKYVADHSKLTRQTIVEQISGAKSLKELCHSLAELSDSETLESKLYNTVTHNSAARADLNRVRKVLGASLFDRPKTRKRKSDVESIGDMTDDDAE